jgi:uncharacterized repeat protein (TIGR03803 family)
MRISSSVGLKAAVIISLTMFGSTTLVVSQTVKVLHSFYEGGGDGYLPIGGLVFDKAGNLYGTTLTGGAYTEGAVYQLIPKTGGGWIERIIHSFDPDATRDGFAPHATLIIDSHGNLYGTTANGGDYGAGAVFELTPTGAGWQERLLHSFDVYDGSFPVSALAFDAAGNIYGTTYYGGSGANCGISGCGTVFELIHETSGGWAYKTLHSFTNDGTDGYAPTAGVILDSAKNIYGTATSGGSGTNCGTSGCGIVFKMTPAGGGAWTETILHSFNLSDGGVPMAPLTLDNSGNLYGLAQQGGVNSVGAVFELTPSAGGVWTASVLHSFQADGVDGYYPEFGALRFDDAGNFYGTTYEGGTHSFGTVFKLTQSGGTWTETILSSFTNGDGSYPESGLIIDQEGNVYGTTYGGGASGKGTVFELTP